MTDHEDFEALMKTWQEAPSEPLPELGGLIRKRTRWIWMLTVMDLVATGIVVVFIAWTLMHDPSEFDRYLSGFLAAVIVLEWLGVLSIRRGTWRMGVQSSTAMLELLIRRCRASILLARFNLWCVLIGATLALIFRIWVRPMIDDIPDFGLDDGTRLVIRIVVVIAIPAWALGAEWYRRRKTRELQRLISMRDELSRP